MTYVLATNMMLTSITKIHSYTVVIWILPDQLGKGSRANISSNERHASHVPYASKSLQSHHQSRALA
jgi:hypothetical protein